MSLKGHFHRSMPNTIPKVSPTVPLSIERCLGEIEWRDANDNIPRANSALRRETHFGGKEKKPKRFHSHRVARGITVSRRTRGEHYCGLTLQRVGAARVPRPHVVHICRKFNANLRGEISREAPPQNFCLGGRGDRIAGKPAASSPRVNWNARNKGSR